MTVFSENAYFTFINEEFGDEWSATSDRDMSLEDIQSCSELFQHAKEMA